jgi:GNAT superfamily N-acetyltransferase
MPVDTKIEGFKIRCAEEKDVPVILFFIKELAVYENLLHEVTATEEILRDSLFVRRMAEAVIGEYNGEPVCFALYFHNFSTFLGKPGIYLEDLFVKPEMRGKGFGKIILSYLAKLAIERDCGRLEWWCLDWNEPSLKFYRNIGAKSMDAFTVFRLDDASLTDLADEFDG